MEEPKDEEEADDSFVRWEQVNGENCLPTGDWLVASQWVLLAEPWHRRLPSLTQLPPLCAPVALTPRILHVTNCSGLCVGSQSPMSPATATTTGLLQVLVIFAS